MQEVHIWFLGGLMRSSFSLAKDTVLPSRGIEMSREVICSWRPCSLQEARGFRRVVEHWRLVCGKNSLTFIYILEKETRVQI